MNKFKDRSGIKLSQKEFIYRLRKSGLKSSSRYINAITAINVKCSCGKLFKTKPYYIFAGDTTSCGCKHLLNASTHNWKGFGEISGSYWKVVKYNAKVRGIEIEITIEDAWEQFLKQNGRCNLSGRRLSFVRSYSKDGKSQTASLDRIDSSKGYISGNIVWLHKDINISKWDKTNKEYIKICSDVVDYQRSIG